LRCWFVALQPAVNKKTFGYFQSLALTRSGSACCVRKTQGLAMVCEREAQWNHKTPKGFVALFVVSLNRFTKYIFCDTYNVGEYLGSAELLLAHNAPAAICRLYETQIAKFMSSRKRQQTNKQTNNDTDGSPPATSEDTGKLRNGQSSLARHTAHYSALQRNTCVVRWVSRNRTKQRVEFRGGGCADTGALRAGRIASPAVAARTTTGPRVRRRLRDRCQI
jgi:hypothetical protein